MESRVNYTLVGFFVVLMTTTLVVIAFWLTAGSRTKVYHKYVVYMQEAVGGLSDQAPVKFNGVQVGYVSSIQLDKKNPQLVRILLAIEDGTPITTSTRAVLMSQGITGIAYLGLMAVTPKAPELTVMEGQKYPVIPSNPSLLVQLDKAVRDVSQNINEVSLHLQKVLSSENTLSFQHTLENIQDFTEIMNRNHQAIEQFIHNISTASEQFPQISKHVDETAVSVKKAADQLNQTLLSAQGSIETLSEQVVPSAVLMMEHLRSAASSIDTLSHTLESDPSAVIRGLEPPQPGPGE